MHADGPPVRGKATGLAVRGVVARGFESASALAADPEHTELHRVYLTDLLRPHGADTVTVGDARGQSYGEMAAAVIADLVPPDRRVDLIVLAFTGPDITPGRATATYLSHVCPGEPFAFAVCDQGTATAFTGLQLVRDYLRTGACRSGLLIVVEQADLHHPPSRPIALPTGHSAVALLCEDPATGPGRETPPAQAHVAQVHVGAARFGEPDVGEARFGEARFGEIRRHADVAPERVTALLAADVGVLTARGPDVTLLLGSQLAAAAPTVADLPGVDRIRVASAGRPLVGVWWDLADELTHTPLQAQVRRVLLADYDPQLRYLCVTAVDIEAAADTGAGATAAAGVRS